MLRKHGLKVLDIQILTHEMRVVAQLKPGVRIVDYTNDERLAIQWTLYSIRLKYAVLRFAKRIVFRLLPDRARNIVYRFFVSLLRKVGVVKV